MGKKREVYYENGRYCGKYLDAKTCSTLESIIAMSDNNGSVYDLQSCIYNLPKSSIDLLKELKNDALIERNKGMLEDHQTLGVAFMYFAKRCILGDSVGMGKTVEVAGLCNLLEQDNAKQGKPFRFLLLTVKTLVPEIRDKMIKFTGRYVDKVYGEKKYIEAFINENSSEVQYSVVGSHSLVNSAAFQQYFEDYYELNGCCPFDIIIIDESGDILTNTSTGTYKNASFIANHFERVILLNATSFEKALNQFYAQLSFVDDTLLPAKYVFEGRYQVKEWNYSLRRCVHNGKYQNEDEFKKLVGYRYFARTRKGIGAEMSDCTADLVVVELSKEQKHLLKVCSMPLMVYDCPSYFSGLGYEVETNVETTPKLRELVKLVSEDLADVPRILVYARYKEAQYAIKRYLDSKGIPNDVMNGDTKTKDKDAIIDRFKLGDIKVLVTNVQKGLDFGDCNHCIFYDYDPNPNNMVQFEGRTTRSRDIINKHVYLLVSEGKELKSLKETVSDRAAASDLFAGSDYSCVLMLLSEKLNGDADNDEVDEDGYHGSF